MYHLSYVLISDPAEVDHVANTKRSRDLAWAKSADRTIIWSTSDDQEKFLLKSKQVGVQVDATESGSIKGQLYLVIQVGRSFQNIYEGDRVILEKGRYLIVDLLPEELQRLVDEGEKCWTIRQLPANSIVVDTPPPLREQARPEIQALTTSVSQSTYSDYLKTLVNYRTRHSLSTDYSNAASWSLNELRQLGYVANTLPISVGAGTSYNVVADRIGYGNEARKLLILTAHLDSINISGGPSASAPGADDNASGSAGVLEIARVFATCGFRHDLRLILFGGEEEGLFGSMQYVDSLPPSERSRIAAVINMDMVATKNTSTPTVLLEGSSLSQNLIDELRAAASTYTSLTVLTSLNPFASDHVPFINALIPVVLTIEGADSANSNIHTANDTLVHIDYELALDILRMNVATVASGT